VKIIFSSNIQNLTSNESQKVLQSLKSIIYVYDIRIITNMKINQKAAAIILSACLVVLTGCPASTNLKNNTEQLDQEMLTQQVKNTNPEQLFLQVLAHLQVGQRIQAQDKLKVILELSPKHVSALDIKQQLELEAFGYFQHVEIIKYEVKNGDSLAKIAKAQLGSELKFVALAKLNGIENPSLIRVGQTLIIPVLKDSSFSASQKEVNALIEQEKFNEAETFVSNIADLDITNRLIVDVALAHAIQLRARGLNKRAKDKLNLVLNNPMAPNAKIEQARSMLKAIELDEIKDQIIDARGKSDLKTLLAILTKHKSEYPILSKDTKTKSAVNWLFEKKHGQAVSLFRQQKLEKAIKLWDKLLAINPTFESAKVYKNRAQLLLKKLQKINT
jgi:tetratricopeptide (TPR) repeat protein